MSRDYARNVEIFTCTKVYLYVALAQNIQLFSYQKAVKNIGAER